jgi:hypothetical protein
MGCREEGDAWPQTGVRSAQRRWRGRACRSPAILSEALTMSEEQNKALAAIVQQIMG